MVLKFNASTVDSTATEIPGFGDEHIKVTDKCLFKDGSPWLPVMGEMQYSRTNEKNWEKSILLMKDAGIHIIASYVIWNHHEEEKGNFRFDGNRDIKKFIKLCKKHDMYFFLRIGPLIHGESRYGGFPDWLVKECKEACKDITDIRWSWAGIGTRRNVEPYMTYAQKYMNTILNEVMEVQDNIIGIQLENELSGPYQDHMRWLKQIALDSGIKVPLYTATGWNNAQLSGTNILPVYGGYADWPWDHTMNDLKNISVFHFRPLNSKNTEIGNDLMNEDFDYEADPDAISYMTCELGPAVQASFHRRPVITLDDTYALAMCALGSGANVLGFYVFHGGYNPIGKYSFLQESKKTNYPNDYPCISYDFQAPIGDAGQIRQSYYVLKELFEFCNNFGEILAPMQPVFAENVKVETEGVDYIYLPEEAVRSAVRSDGEKGFLFVNNHGRFDRLSEKNNVEFEIKLKNKTINIPIDIIPEHSTFYIPFGFEFGDLKTDYITAKLAYADNNRIELIKIEGIEPVLCMNDGEIIKLTDGMVVNDVKITFKEPYNYRTTKGKELMVEPLGTKTKSFACFEHLDIEDKTEEYRISFEAGTRYIKLNWMGNVAAVYGGNKLICDNYYTGTPWVLDVSDLDDEIIIKIQPFTEEELTRIYLNAPAKPNVTSVRAEGTKDEYIFI